LGKNCVLQEVDMMFAPDEVPTTVLFLGVTKHYFPIAALIRAARALQLDSVAIAVDDDGLLAARMDQSHVRYFEWRFPSAAFENYQLMRSFVFSIDCDTERIMHEWDKFLHEHKVLTVKLYWYEGKRPRDYGLYFTMALEDVQFILKVRQELIAPRPVRFGSYHAEVRVDTNELLRLVKPVAKLKLDTVRLELVGDELRITHRDETTGKEKPLGSLQGDQHKGAAASYYGIEYFVPLLKIIREFSSEVRLKFGNDYPIRMSTVWSVGELAFVLAPRKPLSLSSFGG